MQGSSDVLGDDTEESDSETPIGKRRGYRSSPSQGDVQGNDMVRGGQWVSLDESGNPSIENGATEPLSKP